MRGLSEPNGSWNTICIRRRSGRSCAPRTAGDVGAVEADRARRSGSIRRSAVRAERRLAAAGLADEAERLAAVDVKRHVVDRARCAADATPRRVRSREVDCVRRSRTSRRRARSGARLRLASCVLGRSRRRAPVGRRRSSAAGASAVAVARGVGRSRAAASRRSCVARRAGSAGGSAARGQRARRRRRARRSPAARSRPLADERRDRAEQAPACTGWRGSREERLARRRARRSARRTSPPRCRPISATTPRSCVTSSTRHAALLAQPQEQVEDLRLDGHVERRRRLVGDQQLRLARRAPSRSSRAGACRRRTRAGRCRRARPARGMPTSLEQPRSARASRLALVTPLVRAGSARRSGRRPVDRVQRAHRVLEDHRDRACRARFRSSLSVRRQEVEPVELDRPPVIVVPARG